MPVENNKQNLTKCKNNKIDSKVTSVCKADLCKVGFTNTNGACAPVAATASTVCAVAVDVKTLSQKCTILNGTGSETVQDTYCRNVKIDSKVTNPCKVVSCDTGYTLKNGICEKNLLCRSGERSTVPCALDNATAASIDSTCNSSGTGFTSGKCAATACKSEFNLIYGNCTPVNNPPACVKNTEKIESCKQDIINSEVAEKKSICNGNEYALTTACKLKQCLSGFYVSGNVCIQNICEPLTVKAISCTQDIAHASEASISKTCNNNGSAFSTVTPCQVKTCSTGYLLRNNICEAVTIPSSNTPLVYVDFGLYDPDLTADNRWYLVSEFFSEVLSLGTQSVDEVDPIKLKIKISNPGSSSISVTQNSIPAAFKFTGATSIDAGKFDYVYINMETKSIGTQTGDVKFKVGTKNYSLKIKAESVQ
jgi:hypothetical protein